MKEVEKKVAQLLMAYPPLRNDDNALIRVYWRVYDNYDIPPPSSPVTGAMSIIRARQKLQEEGYFLPTDPGVRRRRRKREVEMREWAIS